jgi:SET domain-containing protein
LLVILSEASIWPPAAHSANAVLFLTVTRRKTDMLLVSASVRPSPVHGLGCFTNEPIAKGQVVWQFDARLDRQIPASEVTALPPPVRDFLRMYAYLEVCDGRPVYTLCGDHARHMNHAAAANLLSVSSQMDTALRDIEAGEELTCNYYEFDLDGAEKLVPPES